MRDLALAWIAPRHAARLADFYQAGYPKLNAFLVELTLFVGGRALVSPVERRITSAWDARMSAAAEQSAVLKHNLGALRSYKLSVYRVSTDVAKWWLSLSCLWTIIRYYMPVDNGDRIMHLSRFPGYVNSDQWFMDTWDHCVQLIFLVLLCYAFRPDRFPFMKQIRSTGS
ncbi:hypothetical protein WJX73_001676 [Symbiochloris irregularis]|uniref:Uncharacterized protein n=1 Tax=Symbiochloris irregularis TaxID=706552 RepID=A0AAW1PMK3_9CHLO